MNDYQLGCIKFNNNHASLKMQGAINDMELDRLAAWTAYFKKDYECEELKKKLESCKCGCKVKRKRVVR